MVFWLIAIALFYLPSAAVAVWLNRAMPLEGGLYQWAKLGFNEFFGFIVAWNLWLFCHPQHDQHRAAVHAVPSGMS